MAATIVPQTSMSTATPTNGFPGWWGRLTAPRGHYATEAEALRARLLANVIATMVFVAMPVLLFYFVTDGGQDIFLTLIATLVAAGMFFVNRSGHTAVAAWSIIAVLLFATTYGSYTDGSSIRFQYISNIGIILTALFFTRRHILIVTSGTIAFITLLQFVFVPGRHPVSYYLDSLIFMVVSTTLITVMITHFRGLERLRLGALEVANAQLRESEALLERRVIDRTEQLNLAKQEAETARDRAEKADRVKSQFLASMSHELRTPLNAILNFTEFVAIGMMGPVNDKQADALHKALDSARHLLSLINDVLDITKIESGMMKLFVEDSVDLAAELNTVIASGQSLLVHKPEVQLITDLDPHLPTMIGDKRRIRQIMLNLLSNAIKFTEEGSITLSAKVRGDVVLLAVIDTGPGIAGEDQTLIFEPFKQTETGIQHAHGTGLGLPISLRLAQAHGGRLWVESEPGEGAAFFVELPINPPRLVQQLDVEKAAAAASR